MSACTDSVEPRALVCAHGDARRAGDTLFVRLASGRDTAYIDDTGGEAPGGYHYAGRIGVAFHLIEQYGHETYPTYYVLNGLTGRQVFVGDERPLMSPDRMRFVVNGPGWDNCSEYDDVRVSIWRWTDLTAGGRVERRLVRFCRSPTGWGATLMRWRGADTLEYVEHDVGRAGTNAPYEKTGVRAMLLVREGTTWRPVPSP